MIILDTNPIKVKCPTRCTTCKTGGSSDGGLPINFKGICEHFCSIGGYCGSGEAYKTGDYCGGCRASGNFSVLNVDIAIFLTYD